MDGWKTILSYWVSVTFQGRAVKLREGTSFLMPSTALDPGTPGPRVGSRIESFFTPTKTSLN